MFEQSGAQITFLAISKPFLTFLHHQFLHQLDKILGHFTSSRPIKFAARGLRLRPCFTTQHGVMCSPNSPILLMRSENLSWELSSFIFTYIHLTVYLVNTKS